MWLWMGEELMLISIPDPRLGLTWRALASPITEVKGHLLVPD